MEKNMVEDTSTSIKAQTGEIKSSLVCKDIQLIESKKTLHANGKIKTIPDAVTWNESGKKIKRRLEDHLPNDNKKPKTDNDDTVELLEELKEEVFNWEKYLEDTGSKEVPSSVFKHVVPECMCGFEPGMKLEVPNKDYRNTYWLATIITKAPPLILVRYEGFQQCNNADFWCNTLSDDLHPVGWCARTKHALKPPKSIQHKEKNWYAYLIKHLTGARKASESLFLKKSHPAHYLRASQYVEVLDAYNPTCYWLARIVEVFSGRLNLQYEGLEEKKTELWCYYLNENLRPVGYGIKHGLTLYPPQGYFTFTHAQFSRITEKLLSLSKRTDNSLFKALFVGWPNKIEHNLRLGMKLEALHPNDPTSIYVASVARIFDNYYFLVKVDNLLSTQDDLILNSFVAHRNSPCIFPIGFCTRNGVTLHQPKGYIGKFTWDGYLKYTKSEPIPESFFAQIYDDIKLEVGMKLEAVDKENRGNICVSTISKVVGRHIWLNIDGDTRSDQVFHVDSHDVFPVGWCEATGHELQWPRPNTLEQKNRISSLRHTATRKNRLEVLRKGKLHDKSSDAKDSKKDKPKEKRQKSRHYLKGRRGVSRNRVTYDDKNDTTTDTSIAIVCINRLAEEYNSEESIKRHFHLDADGRLPAEVVTIDDDDDDVDKSKTEDNDPCKYSAADLNFLSFIRVKPNDLSKKEDEMFEKNLHDNDGNQGSDVDYLLSPNSNRERRSLNSVVAMLRATRRPQTKSHLLDQYKQSKSKKTEQPSQFINREKPHKQDAAKTVIDLCDDMGDDEESTLIVDTKVATQDNSIKIPGKGDYRIVEKIVTKRGDKSKIILKLGKALQNDHVFSPNQPPNSQTANMAATNVEDMHTLSNMARSHPGLDEIMRHRFVKVRSICKDLPKNPLVWTKKHVASFITTAGQEKYAKLFYDQEVDGHSLLLLTVQEIHHILGVHLGNAMKIHDYIFTLQQLVNDAYLNNHVKQAGSMETPHDTDSIILERESTSNSLKDEKVKSAEISDTCTMFPKMDVIHWIKTSVIPENEKREVVSTTDIQQTFSKITKTESASNVSKKVFKDVKPPNITQKEDSKNFALPVENFNPVRMIPVSEFNFMSAYNIPGHAVRVASPPVQMSTTFTTPVHMMQYRPANIPVGSEFPIRFGTHLIPLHYIPEQAKETVTPVSKPNEKPIPATSIQPIIIPHIPNTLKRPAEVMYPVPFHFPLQSPNCKKDNTASRKAKIRKTNMAGKSIMATPVCIPPPSFSPDHPWFQSYLRKMDMELESKELWDDFYKNGTEMILTRIGRRMFPTLQIHVTGMDPKASYVIIVDFSPADHYRYKYEYESSQWLIACKETTPTPGRVYVHPESPATGEEWMRNTIDFTRCKLTNNIRDKRGHILMQSMHKYQPRIHIIYWNGALPLHIDPIELLRIGCRKEFVFLQTQFIAVTAYQNSQITQLKIASNPFARGFRGDWRKVSTSDEKSKIESEHSTTKNLKNFDQQKSKSCDKIIPKEEILSEEEEEEEDELDNEETKNETKNEV